MRRLLLRVMVAALMVIGLAGCEKAEAYRYKLTLAVDTPDGVKQGWSVVEVISYRDTVLAINSNTKYKLDGEALYLDLGRSRRPLIVMLMR